MKTNSSLVQPLADPTPGMANQFANSVGSALSLQSVCDRFVKPDSGAPETIYVTREGQCKKIEFDDIRQKYSDSIDEASRQEIGREALARIVAAIDPGMGPVVEATVCALLASAENDSLIEDNDFSSVHRSAFRGAVEAHARSEHKGSALHFVVQQDSLRSLTVHQTMRWQDSLPGKQQEYLISDVVLECVKDAGNLSIELKDCHWEARDKNNTVKVLSDEQALSLQNFWDLLYCRLTDFFKNLGVVFGCVRQAHVEVTATRPYVAGVDVFATQNSFHMLQISTVDADGIDSHVYSASEALAKAIRTGDECKIKNAIETFVSEITEVQHKFPEENIGTAMFSQRWINTLDEGVRPYFLRKMGDRVFTSSVIRKCASLPKALWPFTVDNTKSLGVRVNLRDADLRGADLRDVDLRDVDLRGADLRGADLRGANLRGADLRGAFLETSDLSFADLRDADLRGAGLARVKLGDAPITTANVDLTGAKIDAMGAIEFLFSAQRLTGVQVTGVLGANKETALADYAIRHIRNKSMFHIELVWEFNFWFNTRNEEWRNAREAGVIGAGVLKTIASLDDCCADTKRSLIRAVVGALDWHRETNRHDRALAPLAQSLADVLLQDPNYLKGYDDFTEWLCKHLLDGLPPIDVADLAVLVDYATNLMKTGDIKAIRGKHLWIRSLLGEMNHVAQNALSPAIREQFKMQRHTMLKEWRAIESDLTRSDSLL